LPPLASGRRGGISRGPSRLTRSPIPIGELTPAQLTAWSELAARAAEPNPFFEPEFLLPAARHLGESGIGMLVVQEGDRDWLACMPVCHHLNVRGARVPALSAWRHLYSFLGTPLVAGSGVQEGTERLLEQALRASRLGVFVMPWLGEDGPVAHGLQEALEARGLHPALHRSFERAVLRPAELVSGSDSLMSSRHRRNLGRLARRLGEELGAPLELSDESEREAAVERFLALEASGWKGQRGTALLSRREHADFFRDVCAAFRAAGRLQLLAFGTAERIVSGQCSLLSGDAVFHFKIAFDESAGHYRPGLQLELRMVDLFSEHMPQTWIDSCADPDSGLFRNYWPQRRPIGSWVIASSRAVGWTIDRGAAHLGLTGAGADAV